MNNDPGISYDIIVVDNASSDESPNWLSSNEAKDLLGKIRLHLIRNCHNVGFGRANNYAFQLTKAPFLFLLNPDTLLHPGAIDRLFLTADISDGVGAVGPRLLNPDGSLQPSVYRNPPTAWEILAFGLRLYHLVPKRIRGEILLGSLWDHKKRRDVRFLSGAAIMTRRDMIDDVGGFDERIHLYGEDIEWCDRIARAGWRLIFEPEAAVIHHGSQSSLLRWESQEKYRMQLDANIYSLSLFLSKGKLLRLAAAQCFVLSLEILWRKFRNQRTQDVDFAFERFFRLMRESVNLCQTVRKR